MKKETQVQRWKMVEDYLTAINQCIENAYDDRDNERILQLESDKKHWLKDNFTIGRPSLKNRKIILFNKK